MANITDIERIDGGWRYTLDTPPVGGWDIFLSGARLATRVTGTTYDLMSASGYPPPIEVIRPDLTTPSHYASNSITILWPHCGSPYYLIQYSDDNLVWVDLGVHAYSGGVQQYATEHDIYVDTHRYYRAIPGDLYNNEFVPEGDPVEANIRRASIPPIYRASWEYNATTHVLKMNGEIREAL